jgi:hypothetical protein
MRPFKTACRTRLSRQNILSPYQKSPLPKSPPRHRHPRRLPPLPNRTRWMHLLLLYLNRCPPHLRFLPSPRVRRLLWQVVRVDSSVHYGTLGPSRPTVPLTLLLPYLRRLFQLSQPQKRMATQLEVMTMNVMGRRRTSLLVDGGVCVQRRNGGTRYPTINHKHHPRQRHRHHGLWLQRPRRQVPELLPSYDPPAPLPT